jgi:hypothetical protein
MADVFVERMFHSPIGGHGVHGAARVDACLASHRVRWLDSLLADDGRRMLCWFTAPDAESVRIALRQARLAVDALWSGTVHGVQEADAGQVANVAGELTFTEPLGPQQLQAFHVAGDACEGAGAARFVRAFLSLDRRRLICLYHARDAASVRMARREVPRPFDVTWSFRHVATCSLVAANG